MPTAIACLALALAVALTLGPARAEAGIKTETKRGTKAGLLERGLVPVKISCRLVGRNGKHGARCTWVAAKRSGATTLACRGSGELAKLRTALRFEEDGCKTDRGGTTLSSTAPERLAKEGLEATDVFCWGLLGRGFKCRFEAIRFEELTYDCTGLALQQGKLFTIGEPLCVVDAPASEAQSLVAADLADRGLQPGGIQCRDLAGGWDCRWAATQARDGWTYRCDGSARSIAAAGPFELDPCTLRAPELSPLGAARHNLPFGVNEAWGHDLGEIGRAAALGSDTLRMTVNWASVEATRGQYVFDHFDRAYDRMLAGGVRPLFIVMGAPCWAVGASCTDGGQISAPAAAYDGAWGDFVAAVATRYPEARGLEIWNEPNFDGFFAGGPNPERYARLLQVADQAVSQAGSDLPVITGGLAAFSKNRSGQMRYDTFLRRVLAAAPAGTADAIGHHAYSGRRLEDGHVDGLRIQLADLKDVMLDFGRESMPIWITETGVSTASNGISPGEQAKTNVKAYEALISTPGVGAVIVHRWRDAAGDGPESGYGLTTRSGAAKPALCSLAAARGRSCPE